MEITPDTSGGKSSGTSAKRSRAKPKVVVKTAAAAAPVAAKKPRAPRKTLTTKAAVAPVTAEPVPAAAVAEVVVEPGSEPPGDMIAMAAYYLAAARNFMPGHELDDWLEAERNVRARLYG